MKVWLLFSSVIFLACLPELYDAFGWPVPMNQAVYNNAHIVARARNLQIQQGMQRPNQGR